MKIGMLGFGEVGFTFAKGIKNGGYDCQVYAFDVNLNNDWQGELIRARAKESNVTLMISSEDLAEASDLILSLVPGSESLNAAWQFSDYLASGKFYCDFSSAGPNAKREAGEILHNSSWVYLDGAIMGSMSTYGFQVPIYLSGPEADKAADLLRRIGFNIRPVGREIGTAAAIKMLRSSFTKGIEALLLETFYAATVYQAQDMVLETLADTFDKEAFSEMVTRYLTSSAIHAGRRARELNSVIKLLREIGLEPYMSLATRERLTWMAEKGLSEKFQGITPKDFREVLIALQENKCSKEKRGD